MPAELDRVLVRADCPICAAKLTAPYLQVRQSGVLACGCGGRAQVSLSKIATQVVLALCDDQESVIEPA
jgi:hypothetical protein